MRGPANSKQSGESIHKNPVCVGAEAPTVAPWAKALGSCDFPLHLRWCMQCHGLIFLDSARIAAWASRALVSRTAFMVSKTTILATELDFNSPIRYI